MYNETLATKEIITNGLTLTYTLQANYDGISGQHNFNDQWERSLQGHIGGVTIQSNEGDSWIPLNYSLAQLTKDYYKQGRNNPPKEAYDSLKEQFDRDSEAFEIVVVVTVRKNGIELFEDTIIGSDYHHEDYNYDHDKALNDLLEYAEQDAYIEEAKQVLSKLIEG